MILAWLYTTAAMTCAMKVSPPIALKKSEWRSVTALLTPGSSLSQNSSVPEPELNIYQHKDGDDQKDKFMPLKQLLSVEIKF